MSSFHCSNELLALTPIKYTRTDTKSFWFSLTLFDCLIFLQNISHRIVEKKTVKDKTDILKKAPDIILNQVFFKYLLKTGEISTSIKVYQNITYALSRMHFTLLYSDEA